MQRSGKEALVTTYLGVPEASSSTLPQAAPRLGARVALVSDHPWDAERERWDGMSVALTGSDLRDELLGTAPDAVIVDASADPRRLVGLWEAHGVAGFPVLVVAPGAAPQTVAAWFEQGAEDVITEPAEPKLLAAHVAAILRRPLNRGSAVKSSVLRLGRVVVDLNRRIVSRPEGTYSLSPTEFNILQLLLRAGGRTCTQQELVHRIWGSDIRSGADYLRLYIRYLRHKLEEDPAHPKHVVNVRGLGYRFLFPESHN
jgi:two-component system KDP operon response regulator KdpE